MDEYTDNLDNNFQPENSTTRCGFTAIVGKPNVGKSTLLNAIVGHKLSIITPKVQTTRDNILGVKTSGDTQAVYVDTPGIHSDHKKGLNRYMNKAALAALEDVDLIIFMLSGIKLGSEDRKIIELLSKIKTPKILLINKIDLIKDKRDLLPFIEDISKKLDFVDILPISVLEQERANKEDIARLEGLVEKYLPLSPFLFEENQVTDKSERYRIAELVREKFMLELNQELPYSSAVSIEDIMYEEKITKIYCTLWLERESQKHIVIGEKGSKLKSVGTKARIALEQMLDKKVYLDIRVKVKNSWADDERALISLGYDLEG